MQRKKIFMIIVSFVSFAAVSSGALALTFSTASLRGINGTIETLNGTYKRAGFSAPVPFNLSNFTMHTMWMTGSVTQVSSSTGSRVSGSMTLFAKGYDNQVGTTKYLQSSAVDNVKLNVFASFSPLKSSCSQFSSTRVICTTNVSTVYMFIPSHEDLRFFYEHPKSFTVDINKTSHMASVHAGNNAAGDDILNVTGISLT